MIFDTSSSCDVCKFRDACIKSRKFSEFEELIKKARVSLRGTDSVWPLTTCLNDFNDILPLRFVCDLFIKKPQTHSDRSH